jgi:hypothetical protein
MNELARAQLRPGGHRYGCVEVGVQQQLQPQGQSTLRAALRHPGCQQASRALSCDGQTARIGPKLRRMLGHPLQRGPAILIGGRIRVLHACALFSFKLAKALHALVGRHWGVGISLFRSDIDTVTAH